MKTVGGFKTKKKVRGWVILVLVEQGDGCSLKFCESLLAELKIEQECVTSFFDALVGGNYLTGRLSNVNERLSLGRNVAWC
jgi:hypothetical protein